MLHHVGPQVVADRVGVPPHPAEEVLHPVRRAVARRLRQLPAVLAPQGRQQPAQVRQQTPARLAPPKPRPEPPPTTRGGSRSASSSRPRAHPSAPFTSVMPGTSSRAERPNRG